MKSFYLWLVVGLVACGDTTNPDITQINLDRPVDVAFACYGGLRITNGGGDDTANAQQPVVSSATPSRNCEIRSLDAGDDDNNPQNIPAGQKPVAGGATVALSRWQALILQQGPGTVAIADFATRPTYGPQGEFSVQDADPFTPGINSISIGEEPIGLIVDHLGCSAVTANTGSCDLSVMDLTTALDRDGVVNIARMDVKNGLGQPIRSRPAAIVGEPQTQLIGEYCPSQAPGSTSQVQPRGLAYIAYPSCHLVAGVDLETGTIVTGIQYAADGTASIVTDPSAISCPDECSIQSARTEGPRPVTIDLELDERFTQQRMVIGSENSNQLTIVELDSTSRPLSLGQPVQLEGAIGVTELAMSPVIGVGGSSGILDETTLADFQYVYAVATDQTVRVAEIQQLRTECDTQVDPRFLRSGQDAVSLGCERVGAATTPPRRAGARGPGIDLGKDQVPLSVDFFKNAVGDLSFSNSGEIAGHFAVITSTTGETFVITVDDDVERDAFNASDPTDTPMSNIIPHQPRDLLGGRKIRAESCADEFINPDGGGPRTTALPLKNLAGIIPSAKALALPSVRQLYCKGPDDATTTDDNLTTELGFLAPPEVRDLAYPDWRRVSSDEQLALTWEGSLSQDRADTAANGPVIRESMLYVDQAGMHLRDQTRPYCDAGVEPFDIVQMRGCDPALASTDCPIGYSCYVHPESQVSGLGACIKRDEADRLATACKDFLTSIRRYTVVRADSGELLLTTRRHELRMTPLDGCTSDAQCETLGDLAKRSTIDAQPSDPAESEAVDEHEWVCRTDTTRAPRGTGNKRCNMACDTSSQCVGGTVCVGGNEATPERDGLCMEGVVPPQSCVNAPQRYELRAGEAFVLVGARSGYIHPIQANTAGQCVKPATPNPYQTGRIPLDPPACDPTADPISGRLPGGGFEPNPCATTVTHAERLPDYLPGTCTLASAEGLIKEREAPAIRFRSRGITFSIVDPTYPGDQNCITDRLGPGGTPLVRIPSVFHGYSIGFRIQAGFTPLELRVTPALPVKVLRGPAQSIWVVDQGDFLSTTLGLSSTRGRVFRVDSADLTDVNFVNRIE